MIHVGNIHKERHHLTMNVASLEIPRGYFTIVVGPNGQGKSTLLKLLVGVISDETMTQNGYDKKDVAWMMDSMPFPKGTVADHAEMFKVIHDDFDVDQFYDVYNQFQLKPFTKHDSDGEQRVLYFALVCALNRSIIVLDEPSLNLDTKRLKVMRACLEKILEEQNKTIICATNQIKDFEDLSDYLVVVYRGKVVVQGMLSELVDHYPLWQGESNKMPQKGVLAFVTHPTYTEALIEREFNPLPQDTELTRWLQIYTKGGGHDNESSLSHSKK